MAFDPDQYLAKANAGKPRGGGFDPDAYLAKQGKAPAQDSIQTAQAAPYSDDANPIKSALVGAGRMGLGALNTAARTIDRFTGAPTRAAIGAAQNADSLSDIVPDAISAGAHQFGRDPDQAPSGEDIVKRAGVPEGAASKVLGFGMDMAANPLNVMSLPGAAAKVGEMAEGAAPMIRSGVSKASEFMTGVPSEAIDRLIQRPAQVMSAENEGNALNVAKNARQELLGRDEAEDAAIRKARQTFREQYGNNQVNTTPIMDQQSEFLGHNAPTAEGLGPLSPEEIQTLNSLERKGLTTKQIVQPEVKYSPLKETQLIYGKPVTQPLPIEPPKTIGSELPPAFSEGNPGGMNRGRLNQLQGDIQRSNLSAVNDAGFNPYGESPTADLSTIDTRLKFGKPEVLTPEVTETLPQKSAADLQRMADFLGNEVKRFDQSKLPGTGDTRYQAYLRGLYGKVKDQLHKIDPEGLGAADAQFSDYADKARRLGKLEDENQMEGFINNYFGKNKTLMRESAQDLIPNSVDDIADIGASRAFTKQGPSGSEMGGRRILGSGVGAVLGAHGAMTGSPLEMALGAGASMATSPQVHKAVIGNASKAIDALKGMPWFQAIQKNPALLETISNPSLRQAVQSALGGMEAAPAVGERVDSPMLRDQGSDREPAFDPSGPLIHGDEARRQFLEGN